MRRISFVPNRLDFALAYACHCRGGFDFEPSLNRGGDMDMKFLAGEPSKRLKQIGHEADERNERHKEKGYEVSYKLFSINGKMLGAGDPIRVKAGELTRIAGKQTSGVFKDVVMLGGFQELESDFIANHPGLALFHCHQQLHMDEGFMALFKHAGWTGARG